MLVFAVEDFTANSRFFFGQSDVRGQNAVGKLRVSQPYESFVKAAVDHITRTMIKKIVSFPEETRNTEQFRQVFIQACLKEFPGRLGE